MKKRCLGGTLLCLFTLTAGCGKKSDPTPLIVENTRGQKKQGGKKYPIPKHTCKSDVWESRAFFLNAPNKQALCAQVCMAQVCVF
jgi:hypothetical protein